MANYMNAYRKQLIKTVELLPGEIFQRNDLNKFQLNPQLRLSADIVDIDNRKSNREQLRLNRALNFLKAQGLIIKIGHNLYAKAQSVQIKEKQRILPRVSFEQLAYEALNKLKIKWQPSEAVLVYNRGETTQVPVNAGVRLKSRFRGKIGIGNHKLIFDGRINAR